MSSNGNINYKLNWEKKKTRQKSTATVIVCCCVLVFAFGGLFFFLDKGFVPKGSSVSLPTRESTPEINSIPPLQHDTDIDRREAVPKIDNIPKILHIAPTEKKKTIGLSSSDLQETFKQKLKEFIEELEPSLEAANTSVWASATVTRIETGKKEALSLFGKGSYSEADSVLQSTFSMAHELVEKAKQIHDEELSNALTAYADHDHARAVLHIEKALEVRPGSPELRAHKSRIDQLPELLAKLELAQKARAERDKPGELEALKEAILVSPDQTDLSERIAELEKLILQERFSSRIARGFRALDQGNVLLAEENLREARSIYPNRQELTLLTKQIIAIRTERRIQGHLETARTAIARDNWIKAKDALTSAEKDAPNNEEVVSGLQNANAILAFSNSISGLLQNPYRLSVNTVNKKARETLGTVIPFFEHSPALRNQASELAHLLEAMNRPVAIEVLSDTETFVQVRGVGKVGRIAHKTIRLKPGHYTFEGTRQGYKSKLLKVLIPHDQKTFQIKVVCDEPI